MKTHPEQQGTNSWLALRRDYFTASEAAAVMGDSPYCTRTQLLQQKATGITPEIDARTQARFDAGHATEAAFRPIAERIVGVDFYPVTGSIEIDGLKLLASFDGLSADDSIAFEHKLFSAKLADMCMNMGDVTDPAYYWQLEQQLLISGAERVEFFTSDGTDSKFAQTTYTSQPDRREALIAAWKQFAVDLDAYVPQEYIPAPVAQAVTALPAVAVQVTGSIDVRDNFKVFQTALTDFIDNRLIRDPKTDQDFADLALQIKALENAEAAIKGAEANMLSQVESVDTAKRMMGTLHAMARDNRLMAEKLLDAKKASVKADIVREGRDTYEAHVEALRRETGPWIVLPAPDFATAIKGLRTIDSLRNAVSTALANGKIAANESASRIRAALACIAEEGKDYEFLLSDKLSLIGRPVDDLRVLIRARITEHKAAEQKRLDDERERIRAEEVKKLADAAAATEKQRLADEEVSRVKAANAAAAEAAKLAALSQPKPEEVAQVAPAVASVSPAPTVASPLRSFASASVASSEPSSTVLAFLASRNWPTKAIEQTARATLIEFERFCAQRLKAAA